MFTGIVQEIGKLEAVDRTDEGAKLRIAADLVGDLREGDSVSVNGVCLTATFISETGFAADVMNQTLSLTSLGQRVVGDRLNLEPALRAGEPMGGHLV
jgi:riboflavin synthase